MSRPKETIFDESEDGFWAKEFERCRECGKPSERFFQLGVDESGLPMFTCRECSLGARLKAVENQLRTSQRARNILLVLVILLTLVIFFSQPKDVLGF